MRCDTPQENGRKSIPLRRAYIFRISFASALVGAGYCQGMCLLLPAGKRGGHISEVLTLR